MGKQRSAFQSIFSRENIEAILIAVVLALFIRTFIVQAFKIPSGSMLETIQLGDHILVNKFIFGVKLPFVQKTIIPVKAPAHDDIVVFTPPHEPDKDYIKRVIGIAGDTIEIRKKRLYRNGKRITAPYEIHMDSRLIPAGVTPRDDFGPVTVPADSIFLMGDNRDSSLDSRFWGFVKLDKVKGKAFIIYWSWNKERFGVRWKRIG
ncbi:MAG: signal peptidase I, partial [Deltaproteobacteria bacterium]|nr:signal peptidase I [Deltaproteobacteria bacterium]